jgi:hypothetical protein
MAAVPIVAMAGNGDVIIDMERLLKSNLANVTFLGGGVNRGLSTWQKVKTFPDNVLIDVDLALAQGQGGRKVGVSYSFRRLPNPGQYSPRAADPRVGYFLTAKVDWSKEPSARETFERYIHRWDLQKLDPSLKLSPPKEPIVFIIEKTVPVQWRRWVRDGILEWNKAFEQIGFTDAIIVQQQTDDNEYAGYDPEDARYNFFRWGVTGRAFAMGPSRVDPRTGQILDADIMFDDSFVRAWMQSFDIYGPAAIAEAKGPGFTRWLEEQPELVPDFIRKALAEKAQDPEYQEWAAFEQQLHEQGRCACSYSFGMQQQLALAYHALIATGSGGKKMPERFIGEAIKEVVTHEVGHTLGLRHNFKASSWLTLKEILHRRDNTSEPTTSSVMDYNPLLFFPGDKVEDVKHFVSPTIGPYDEWAIAYGYTVPQGQSEKDALAEILKRCTEPALQYATDHDTMWIYSPDPLVNRYDYGKDPIEYAGARAELTGDLLENITEWAVQDGESMAFLRRAYRTVWFERIRNMEYVARLVGGQYFNRHHKGDPDAQPPFVLVEPEKQRAALKYLTETVFSDDFFMLDAELLNKLAPSRWSHWGVSTPVRLDFPIHDQIRGYQVSVLMTLMAPPVLGRVYDAELKSTADDKFTAAELITTVRDSIWQQLDSKRQKQYTDAKPFISSVSRNLQRDHLHYLLVVAQGRPGQAVNKDLHAMVRLALRDLSDQIDETLDERELDFASRAHLIESKSRIDRTLQAEFTAQ